MLELINIKKDYETGDTKVAALKGINLRFRDCEFVSILGQSGCGKTTMLNIIGGLDKYTSGDLRINGVSTKDYKDRDWDAYRNNSIGFVFQSYNLIPHQTVLSNVELALTLSGVSKAERRKRAVEALEKVGLGEQIHKKPNQMSGGQMQRVAIARALVNNPDILLADEPTGALDTETSVQIMELLKEISKDRLIIMVTHNPELAMKYSTRIVTLLPAPDADPRRAAPCGAGRHPGRSDDPDVQRLAVLGPRVRLLRRGPARRRSRTIPLRQRIPARQTGDRRRHAGVGRNREHGLPQSDGQPRSHGLHPRPRDGPAAGGDLRRRPRLVPPHHARRMEAAAVAPDAGRRAPARVTPDVIPS